MTKFCSACKQTQPFTLFAKNSRKKDGLQTHCKSCQTTYGQKRYQNDKQSFRDRNDAARIRNQIVVYQYLLHHPCVDCGITDPVVLTFDHLRDKKMTVSDMVKQSYSLKTIFEEIAKCEVRCFNCHMRKDSLRRGGLKWKALNSSDDSFDLSLYESLLDRPKQAAHNLGLSL